MKKQVNKLSLNKITISKLQTNASSILGGAGGETYVFCKLRTAISFCNTVFVCVTIPSVGCLADSGNEG